MAKLLWDQTAARLYETGVKNGALYVQDTDGSYMTGVVWNGLTSVSESPEGAEANDIYADDIKYLSLRSAENYKATVEAYTYPAEFAQCDGSASLAPGVMLGQQKRRAFGFTYTTSVGNDVENNDFGYKIHIVYNCTAAPSEKAYQTINDSPEAITFSWEISTTPMAVIDKDGNEIEGFKPTACITIDSTVVNDEGKMTQLKNKLYGTSTLDPTLPTPADLLEIFGTKANQTT